MSEMMKNEVAVIDKVNQIPGELRETVKKVLIRTGALGTLGPYSSAVDIASIALCWGELLVKFSQHYGYSMNLENAKRICTSVVMGISGYIVGSRVASKAFMAIPGAGLIIASGISSLENLVFTYRFATVLLTIFENNNINFNTIAETVKTMFSGRYSRMKNIVDIVKILSSSDLSV